MTDNQRARLESLVFSVPHPAQSLDARLEPYVALIAEIERTAIEAERARILEQLARVDTGVIDYAALVHDPRVSSTGVNPSVARLEDTQVV